MASHATSRPTRVMPRTPAGTNWRDTVASTGSRGPRRHAVANSDEPRSTSRPTNATLAASRSTPLSPRSRYRPSRTGSRKVVTHSGPSTAPSSRRTRWPPPAVGAWTVDSATWPHPHDPGAAGERGRHEQRVVLGAGRDRGHDPVLRGRRLPGALEAPGLQVEGQHPVVALVQVLGPAERREVDPPVADHRYAAGRATQVQRPRLRAGARVEGVHDAGAVGPHHGPSGDGRADVAVRRAGREPHLPAGPGVPRGEPGGPVAEQRGSDHQAAGLNRAPEHGRSGVGPHDAAGLRVVAG